MKKAVSCLINGRQAQLKQETDYDDDLIIRCIKTSGIRPSAEMDLSFAKLRWKGNFRPCETKTLRLNMKNNQITEVNLLEE